MSKEFDLDSLGFVIVRGDWSYRDATYNDAYNTPLLETDSYALIDASVRWQDCQRLWTVALLGLNLGDEEYLVTGVYGTAFQSLEGTFDRGRQWQPEQLPHACARRAAGARWDGILFLGIMAADRRQGTATSLVAVPIAREAGWFTNSGAMSYAQSKQAPGSRALREGAAAAVFHARLRALGERQSSAIVCGSPLSVGRHLCGSPFMATAASGKAQVGMNADPQNGQP